jgi:universal stress protein E
MQILAATDFSTRSNRALRQAGLLAQPRKDAELHVVHVVDDDQPEDLIRIEKREAERIVGEQVASMPELQGTKSRAMVVTGDPFDGILRAAKDVNADLIVMGSHRKQLLLDIFTGTTIERVARKGRFPVLMVNHEAQRKYANVVAPVDMSDSSADALHIAHSTGLISDAGATLVHAFAAPAKGKMYIGGADQASMDEYVEKERHRAMDELLQFLGAHNMQEGRWYYRVEDGAPMEVISRAVSEMRPDLLVMGTHGRSAISKVLMGSVTEEALRSLNVDILVVPPVKR